MLFIHPMWDNESQRIGLQKCTPFGYTVRGLGEIIGFLGLLILLGTAGYTIFLAFTDALDMYAWLLFIIPLAMGVISEIMVQTSWMIARWHGFEYDFETRKASWTENGKRVYYRYKQQDAPGDVKNNNDDIYHKNEKY